MDQALLKKRKPLDGPPTVCKKSKQALITNETGTAEAFIDAKPRAGWDIIAKLLNTDDQTHRIDLLDQLTSVLHQEHAEEQKQVEEQAVKDKLDEGEIQEDFFQALFSDVSWNDSIANEKVTENFFDEVFQEANIPPPELMAASMTKLDMLEYCYGMVIKSINETDRTFMTEEETEEGPFWQIYDMPSDDILLDMYFLKDLTIVDQGHVQ